MIKTTVISATKIKQLLEGLVGNARLDASAIKNLISSDEDVKNLLENLVGDDRLIAGALKGGDTTEIYYCDMNLTSICKVNPNGDYNETLNGSIANIHSIAVYKDRLYFTVQLVGSSKIQSADLDGGNVADILTGMHLPSFITIFDEKIYWSNKIFGYIKRCDLDGGNIETIVNLGVAITGIDIYSSLEKIYWIKHLSDQVWRADLNGGNQELVVSGAARANGLSLDAKNEKIYWAEYDADKIRRSNLDGSNIQDICVASAPYAVRVDPYFGKIYFTEMDTNKLVRCDLDGSNREELVDSLDSPLGLAIYRAGGIKISGDFLVQGELRAGVLQIGGGSGPKISSDANDDLIFEDEEGNAIATFSAINDQMILERNQNSSARLRLDNANTGTGAGVNFIFSGGGVAYAGNYYNISEKTYKIAVYPAGSEMFFSTENVERMRIKKDGKIGVGTNDPNTILHLKNVSGVTFGDGNDTDQDLLTVGVTGMPKLSWDEAADSFRLNKNLIFPGGVAGGFSGHTGKLSRNSVTAFQIQAWHVGTLDKLRVNGEDINISTAKICTLSDNLISADGSDSGAAPASVSTLYYAYVSNAQASIPSVLRLSATAPTNGHLGASGAAHYRFVGVVYLGTTLQIPYDWSVCGYGVESFQQNITSQIIRSSGAAGVYDINRFDNFAYLQSSILQISARVHQYYAPPIATWLQHEIHKGVTALGFTRGWGGDTAGIADVVSAVDRPAIAGKADYVEKYYYKGSGTIYIGGAAAYYNSFDILRVTI